MIRKDHDFIRFISSHVKFSLCYVSIKDLSKHKPRTLMADTNVMKRENDLYSLTLQQW